MARFLEAMSLTKECVKVKEELEWLKVLEAAIEYNRVCK